MDRTIGTILINALNALNAYTACLLKLSANSSLKVMTRLNLIEKITQLRNLEIYFSNSLGL